MAYELFFWPAARRELRKLPREIRQKIGPLMECLRTTPRPAGVEKLAGHSQRWRVRIGDYRIIFEIDDNKQWIVVVAVGHRGAIYRKQ